MKKNLSFKKLKNLLILSALVVALIFTYSGVISAAEVTLDSDGSSKGFDGDPAMPTLNEIKNNRIESGYNDFVEGSDIIDNGPECFDYYHFQSVQVSLGTDKDSYSPGEIIKVSGDIINENDYPVVDGNVFVRVSKSNENFTSEGHFIVDEFIAIEKVAIDKNSRVSGSFEWEVPSSFVAGDDYRFDYFFSVGKKFNLGGLPFTNEIIIGSDSFEVTGEQDSSIYFDRSNTKVNGASYQHIGGWPRFSSGDEIFIEQPLANTFDEEKEVSITYDLYFWDSLDKDDLLETRNENATIPAGENIVLEYTIPEMNDSVYYLKITANSGSQKSIVNIRVVSNQEHPRLNYPAITKFPLKEGEEFTLFSCFHNSADISTIGSVNVSIFARNGGEIGSTSFTGVIPPSMVLSKAELVAEKDYEYLKLKAEIYDKDGGLIDSYESVYDCQDLLNCEEKSLTIWIVLVILLLVGALTYSFFNKHKEEEL